MLSRLLSHRLVFFKKNIISSRSILKHILGAGGKQSFGGLESIVSASLRTVHLAGRPLTKQEEMLG